jgi:hypothetical protein
MACFCLHNAYRPSSPQGLSDLCHYLYAMTPPAPPGGDPMSGAGTPPTDDQKPIEIKAGNWLDFMEKALDKLEGKTNADDNDNKGDDQAQDGMQMPDQPQSPNELPSQPDQQSQTDPALNGTPPQAPGVGG